METDAVTPPAPAAPAAPAAHPLPRTDPAPPADPPKRTLEGSLGPLDEQTRAYVLAEVAKARRDAADSRSAAKKTAADEARSELTKAIGQAIGLVEPENVDPAELTRQIETQTAAARQARIELAIFHAASAAGADPMVLLDSRRFMQEVAEVDPADTAAITRAVTAAVKANPSYAAVRLPRPGAVPAPGNGSGTPPDLETQLRAAAKAGDHQAYIALQNQKLRTQ